MEGQADGRLTASPMGSLVWFIKFIRGQWTPLQYPTSDFSGQTIIVTGSNAGLGFEAAKHIVRLQAAKVILAVRTVSKGEAAKERIVQALRLDEVQAHRIEVWPLDLSNYNTVLAFGDRAAKLDRLDAVVQNAGILTEKWEIVDGLESHIAVDTVGAILLGLAVLPALQHSAKTHNTRGRLSFVGSDVAYVANFRELDHYPHGPIFDALNDQEIAVMAAPMGRYGVSKLLLWYGVRWLASMHPLGTESNVVINIQTPGACESELFRDDTSWVQKQIQAVMTRFIARTTEVGSRTLVHAVHPGLGVDAHGAFLQDCKVQSNGPNVDSPDAQRLATQFVRELEDKLESIKPGIAST